MNFGDKLIKLRKKEGMSQEELGDKLGVTRQTVSKWELGQTTPEMDKLKDISTLFNISVNYLINDNYGETEESGKDLNELEGGKSVMDEKQNGTRKIILIVAVVIIGIMLVGGIIAVIVGGTLFNWVFDNAEKGEQKVYDVLNGTQESLGGIINNSDESEQQINDAIDKGNQLFENIKEQMNGNNSNEESEKEFDKKTTTMRLEVYKGTNSCAFVNRVIDEIANNNNKNKDYQIKLEIDGVEYTEAEEMISAKSTLDSTKDYEIMYKYDDDGYVIQAIIK